jgi:hypothetical protein
MLPLLEGVRCVLSVFKTFFHMRHSTKEWLEQRPVLQERVLRVLRFDSFRLYSMYV